MEFELVNVVIKNSVSKIWEEAVYEWEIYYLEVDETIRSSCVCGHENIKYLYTIRNVENNNFLFPIGSSCINRFERDDLKDITTIYEKLFKLLKEYETNRFIDFNSNNFSRKLLEFLWEDDCFKPSKYNSFDGENDYVFLLTMFNKRNRITEAQERKVKAILVTSIVPYLKEKIKKRTK